LLGLDWLSHKFKKKYVYSKKKSAIDRTLTTPIVYSFVSFRI